MLVRLCKLESSPRITNCDSPKSECPPRTKSVVGALRCHWCDYEVAPYHIGAGAKECCNQDTSKVYSSELSSLVIFSSCGETSGPVFANACVNSAFILAALSAALVVCFISDKTAQAEPHYRSWDDYDQSMPHYRSSGWDEYEPLKQKRKRPQTNYQSQQKAKSPEVRKGPLQIVLSIADQRLSVYEKWGHRRMAKSFGKRMHPCDAGWPGTTPACNAIPDQVIRCM